MLGGDFLGDLRREAAAEAAAGLAGVLLEGDLVRDFLGDLRGNTLADAVAGLAGGVLLPSARRGEAESVLPLIWVKPVGAANGRTLGSHG